LTINRWDNAHCAGARINRPSNATRPASDRGTRVEAGSPDDREAIVGSAVERLTGVRVYLRDDALITFGELIPELVQPTIVQLTAGTAGP